uniref:Uncharacterized protein n=1 Tax=Triticum urartu TaxID=4572 RepID=A0A8R7V4B6_TRIUA
MRHDEAGVFPPLAVVQRRDVEARLHGHVPAARPPHRAIGDMVQHPGLEPAEPLRHVPERRLPGGHQHVRHAQQVHLRPGLVLVRPHVVALRLLVARLVHHHHLAVRRRALPVHLLHLVAVPALEGGDQDGRRLLGTGSRRLVVVLLLVQHRREQPLALRARLDLLQDLRRLRLPGEDAHLDAHHAPRRREVRAVVPRDEAPHWVRRVEQVAAEVVEHGVRLREEHAELLLERLHQEQPWHDVAVRPHHQPLDIPENPLVVVAEEELVVVRLVVVEVDVRERRQLGGGGAVRLAGSEHSVLPHSPKPLRRVEVKALVVEEWEPRRQQPRRVWERLAEELVHHVAGVDEEDAVGEQRVEERRRRREDPVAEATVRDGDQVSALR